MAGGMPTSWLAMATLLMLSGCSWMLAEGQTCSLSGIYLLSIIQLGVNRPAESRCNIVAITILHASILIARTVLRRSYVASTNDLTTLD